jgi:uncharacterized protein (TIGR03083 family)
MTLDFLGALRRESDRFLAVLGDADPSARVPSCPDWDASDLLWHLGGEVQWFWGSIVLERRQTPDDMEKPDRPSSYAELHAFATEQAARLHGALASTPPETAVWMWSDEKTVGYIGRRQAHEALIHRLDAEQTVGAVTPLDAELASDGVLEVLDKQYGGCPEWGSFAPSGVQFAVEVSDTGLVVPVALGRFTGTDPDDGKAYDEDDISVRFADPTAEPRTVVRGKAADLDAWLWNRRDDDGITVEGDREVFERFVRLVGGVD